MSSVGQWPTLLNLIVAIVVAGAGVAVSKATTDTASEAPKHVAIKRLERVGTFVAANHIPFRTSQRTDGFYIDPDKTTDAGPFFLAGLLALTFEDGTQGFTAAGRALSVDQPDGGRHRRFLV